MRFLDEHQARVFRRYLVSLVLAVGGALLASGLVEGYAAYQQHTIALARLQRETARSTAGTVGYFVTTIVRQIQWSQSFVPPGMAVTPEMRREGILRALRQAPELKALDYYDASGRAVVWLSRLTMGGMPPVDEVSFREARARGIYHGPLYLRFGASPNWLVAVAEPGPDGGVTVGQAGAQFVWDVIARVKLGEAGLAYIVDSEGRLVAHPDRELVYQRTDFSSLPQVQAALAAPPQLGQEDGALISGRDPQGRAVLTTVVALYPPGWLLFVEQPYEEALAPVYGTMVRTAVLVAVGVVVSILVSLMLARRWAATPAR
jgi:hypothetical protein